MVHNTSSFFSGNGNRTQTTASRSDRREGTGQSRGSFDQDRRETVVVSSLELRQIFESIKLLHNTVKEQSGKLEQLTNDVSFVKAELEKLSSTVDGLRSELPLIKEAANEQAGSQHYGPVPKAVKVKTLENILLKQHTHIVFPARYVRVNFENDCDSSFCPASLSTECGT